jgi:hypothetical protein
MLDELFYGAKMKDLPPALQALTPAFAPYIRICFDSWKMFS